MQGCCLAKLAVHKRSTELTELAMQMTFDMNLLPKDRIHSWGLYVEDVMQNSRFYPLGLDLRNRKKSSHAT